MTYAIDGTVARVGGLESGFADDGDMWSSGGGDKKRW